MHSEAESESDVASSDDEGEREGAAQTQGAARAAAAAEPRASLHIATNADAFAVVQAKLRAQLALPADAKVASRRLAGDAAARAAFLTLLPLAEQRRLFLGTLAGHPRAAGRARALFGAPPYPWLLAGDGVALQAAALAPSRRHMSGQDALDGALGGVAAFGAFGAEHYVDDGGRKYRVTPLELTSSADRFFVASALEGSAAIHFTCRAPRRARRAKPLAAGTPPSKAAVARLPRVGEVVRLRLGRALGDIDTLMAFRTLLVRVVRVRPRRAGASTALVETARV